MLTVRRFAMRAGVLAGAVSVIAAGVAGFGAGSASASPDMSPNRVGQVQPRNLPPRPERTDAFATDDPVDPGSPCTPGDPPDHCGDQPPAVNPYFPYNSWEEANRAAAAGVVAAVAGLS